MTTRFTESTVEDAALAWLEAIGCKVAHGPEMAPDMVAPERSDYGERAVRPSARGRPQVQGNRQR